MQFGAVRQLLLQFLATLGVSRLGGERGVIGPVLQDIGILQELVHRSVDRRLVAMTRNGMGDRLDLAARERSGSVEDLDSKVRARRRVIGRTPGCVRREVVEHSGCCGEFRIESASPCQPRRHEGHTVEVDEAAAAVLVGRETEEDRVHFLTHELEPVHGAMVQRHRVMDTVTARRAESPPAAQPDFGPWTADHGLSWEGNLRTEILEDGLRVRAFRADDVQPLHEAVSESIVDIAPFETWCHPGFSLTEAKEYVDRWIQARERKRAFYYAVEDAATLRFLGACGVGDYSAEHRHAMLGYWVRASATGRGVATAAARLVVSAAFADLQLLRVSIGVPVANVASHRVAAKLGAVREGVMRHELLLPAGPSDVVLYSLLPGEPREA